MEHLDKRQTAISSNLASQNVSSTSNQSAQIDVIPRFHNSMPVNWAFQQWPSAERSISQSMVQLPIPVNMGSYPLLSMNNQPIQSSPTHRMQAPMPVLLNHDHLSSSNKQALSPQVPLDIHSSVPTSVSSQTTSKHKRPMQIRPSPKVQTVIGNNMGLQHLPSANKRPAPPQPLQKVQAEPFLSVRSKLRESLAASLAMVSEDKKQQQAEENDSVAEHAADAVSGKEPVVCDPSLASEVSNGHSKNLDENQNISCDVAKRKNGFGESQPKHAFAEDEMAVDASAVKDELLQGHGLCWVSEIDTQSAEATTNHGAKRLKVEHKEATSEEKEGMAQKVENLAFQIELELYKLFGGVNKKYKEKGRSLLFNLKDRSNPELRERVLSGEIEPERLCAMTTEELASKELSEWRQAKAEELAQMVVLPDSEVDVRRLVKKTHKGEFQVELEQPDTVSVEVGLGTSVVPQLPPKVNEARMQRKSGIKNDNSKASDSLLSDEKPGSSGQNLTSSLDNLLQEKTDLIEVLMEDDLKDPELLPPIVSLDEFMLALDSEPPFENLPVDSAHETPSSGVENGDRLETKTIPESDSSFFKADPTSDTVESKLSYSNEGLESKLNPSQEDAELNPEQANTSHTVHSANSPAKVDEKFPGADKEVKNALTQVQSNSIASEATSANIWEGLIQLTISSLATVIGVFKSGERAPTLDWPSLIEIKGRVRLDAFEKFLQDLPLSRSRAVMIAQFHCKAGTSESGRMNLQEVVDSYIADERVGFAEPVAGVELYFCPPSSRMTELVKRCLPKDEADALQLAADALVGVTVWRRQHSTISPRLPSHHKHGNTKRQFSSRKPPGISSNSTINSAGLPSPTPRTSAVKPPDDDVDDDVPPGFGPKDDDDLPEFNFVHSSSQNSKLVTSQPSGSVMNRSHVLPAARPVDQIRQLIHKYGQTENAKIPSRNAQPWKGDDEDDDIPEWQPNHHPQAPPPPPLPPQLHPYLQQQNTQAQPFQSGHQLVQTQPQPHQMLHHPQAPQQQFVPLATSMQMQLQLPLQPQVGMIPGQFNVNVNMANSVQPSYYNPQQQVSGQAYNLPNVGILPNGMAWRPDVSRSRGV